MKVIFLDIDGVLNTDQTYWRERMKATFNGDDVIEPTLVAKVNQIVAATDAVIVISSTWREFRTLDELRDILAKFGLVDAHRRIIGQTPVFYDRPRQDEIRSWLRGKKRKRHVQAFVVLDDDTAQDLRWEKVQAHFIRVNPRTGLTDNDVVEAIVILQKRSGRHAKNQLVGGRGADADDQGGVGTGSAGADGAPGSQAVRVGAASLR